MLRLWKTCLSPAALNDYSPVALASHVMKFLKRLVLNHLRLHVETSLDPLQIAYRHQVGVDNAIIYQHQLSVSPGLSWQHCKDSFFSSPQLLTQFIL